MASDPLERIEQDERDDRRRAIDLAGRAHLQRQADAFLASIVGEAPRTALGVVKLAALSLVEEAWLRKIRPPAEQS